MENTQNKDEQSQNKKPNINQFDEAYDQLSQFLFEQYRKQKEYISLNDIVTIKQPTNLITEEQ